MKTRHLTKLMVLFQTDYLLIFAKSFSLPILWDCKIWSRRCIKELTYLCKWTLNLRSAIQNWIDLLKRNQFYLTITIRNTSTLSTWDISEHFQNFTITYSIYNGKNRSHQKGEKKSSWLINQKICGGNIIILEKFYSITNVAKPQYRIAWCVDIIRKLR